MLVRLKRAIAVSTSSLGSISFGFTASGPVTRTAHSASRKVTGSPFLIRLLMSSSMFWPL